MRVPSVTFYKPDYPAQKGLGLAELSLMNFLLQVSPHTERVWLAGANYFRLSLPAAAQSLILSERNIRRVYLPRLVSSGLISKQVVARTDGHHVFYTLNIPALEEAVAWDLLTDKQTAYLERIMKQATLIDIAAISTKLHPRALAILQEVLAYKMPDSEGPLFATKLPKEGQEPSKALAGACQKLAALYQGTWFRQCGLEQYPENYDASVLKRATGDWDYILGLVVRAARSYQLARRSDYRPFDKSVLTRDINQWLYSS